MMKPEEGRREVDRHGQLFYNHRFESEFSSNPPYGQAKISFHFPQNP